MAGLEKELGVEELTSALRGVRGEVAAEVVVGRAQDGSDIVPVKLEIKEFADKQNTLYVAIALESIKKDFWHLPQYGMC